MHIIFQQNPFMHLGGKNYFLKGVKNRPRATVMHFSLAEDKKMHFAFNFLNQSVLKHRDNEKMGAF